mgnify:FL=1
MWTIKYKGWYICGYCDRSDCSVVLPKGGHWANCKTLLGAKRIISRDSKWVNDKSEGTTC